MLAPESLLSRNDLTFLPPYEAPETAAERTIANLWAEHFKLDRVGRNDDYFELGGDSFGAVALALALQESFGKPFESSQFIEFSTVARQAACLTQGAAEDEPAALPWCLRGVQVSGSKPAFFWVHGGLGVIFVDRRFLEILGPEQPMYLFRLPGLDGTEPVLTSVEAIAARYVESMRAVQPSGPYRIVANCACGWIGLEMALQLEAAGQTVEKLILVDPTSLGRKNQKVTLAQTVKLARKKVKRWLGSLTGRQRKPVWADEVAAFAENYSTAATAGSNDWRIKRVRLIQEGKVDAAGEVAPPAQVDAAAITAALDHLTRAIRAYKPDRAWRGRADIVSSADRTRNLEVWRTYIEAVDAHPLPGAHRDVFGACLPQTASLIRSALDRG
jgi:thioesterase domain-containing protein/acyl carrier protein